jgi:hypothetical protein
MITALQHSFLEARTVLPPVAGFDGQIVVVSVGCSRGTWSYYHVQGSNDIEHFVFAKDLTASH